jgi:hypothetical protein
MHLTATAQWVKKQGKCVERIRVRKSPQGKHDVIRKIRQQGLGQIISSNDIGGQILKKEQ